MTGDRDQAALIETQERPDVPVLGAVLGFGAMLPLVAGALAAWVVADARVMSLTLLWGATVLGFLAGVRRGLSFRTPGGETKAQLATMLRLFLLAFASLASPSALLSSVLLIVGFAAMAVLDPAAARRHEVPLFFARLRPVQMLVPVASLAVLAAHIALLSQ